MAMNDVTIFDQLDLQIIARRLLVGILNKAKQDDRDFLILIGRKLTEKEAISETEANNLSFIMMGLRLDGIIVVPPSILNHLTGRMQLYRHICIELYAAISAK